MTSTDKMNKIVQRSRFENRLKRNRNDEYYTTYDSVIMMMSPDYVNTEFLRGRAVYCNCDDYRWSSFYKWFKDHYDELGLAGLYASNYDIGDGAFLCEYDGADEKISEGIGDGSYENYVDLVRIVRPVIITNPPFSLYKNFARFLMDHELDFYLIGKALSIANNFTDIIDDVYAYKCNLYFRTAYEWWDCDVVCLDGITTFSNCMVVDNRSTVKINKSLSQSEHRWNDDGVLMVDKCSEIPNDYNEPILVPVSFMLCRPCVRKMFRIITDVKFSVPKGTFKRIMIQRR